MNIEPKHFETNFICPHCKITAQQDWTNNYTMSKYLVELYSHAFYDYRKSISDYQQKAIESYLSKMENSIGSYFRGLLPEELSISHCKTCNKVALWIEKEMVYPNVSIVTEANPDLSEEIKSLYNEAALILSLSPKGATALLRLSLQKLLVQIGKSGKNINADIKELVAQGLSPKIQQALDLLRVAGNNAVHPGQIDFEDSPDVAKSLFKVLNLIAEEMISKPKEIEGLYGEIVPDETKLHIKQRDEKK